MFIRDSIVRAYLKFVLWMTAVAVALISFHLYIESTLPFAGVVRAVYSMNQQERPNHQIWPLFDIVLPATSLFVLTYAYFRQQPFWHTVVATALFSGMVVALLPVDAVVLPAVPLWWWARHNLITDFVRTFVFFCMGGSLIWLVEYAKARELHCSQPRLPTDDPK